MYGKLTPPLGENLEYSNGDATDIIIGLYIDDGVPSRGHRHNLMDIVPKSTGICYGKHPIYGNVTGIVYAGGFTLNKVGKNKIASFKVSN